jgi:putative transposase
VSPSRKRAAVVELRTKFGISERRACKAIDQPRSSQRFKAKPSSDEAPLVMRMLQLARARPRFGYRRIGSLLGLEGWRAGLSRVFRLWRREGLKVPHKKRKRRRLGTSANGCHRRRAEGPNDVWCWDFIFDRTESGSQLKWLSVVDEYTRECLALKVDRGITSSDVIDTLAELFAMRGVPRQIRSDNGPEFIATEPRAWLDRVGVSTLSIEPGSPGRTATPRASTADSVTSAWLWRSSKASVTPGRSRQPGGTTTTTGGLTARSITRPRPGSPPRVRLPPQSDPTLNPHIAWYRKSKPVRGWSRNEHWSPKDFLGGPPGGGFGLAFPAADVLAPIRRPPGPAASVRRRSPADRTCDSEAMPQPWLAERTARTSVHRWRWDQSPRQPAPWASWSWR